MQWGLFDRQFGRSDAEDPDPEGRLPDWERSSVVELKNKFSALGFGPRQVNDHTPTPPIALGRVPSLLFLKNIAVHEILQNVMLSNLVYCFGNFMHLKI